MSISEPQPDAQPTQSTSDVTPDQAPEQTQPDADQSQVIQPEPSAEQAPVEPLPVAPDASGNPAPVSAVDQPGLSPAAHNPDLVSETPESSPTQAPSEPEPEGDQPTEATGPVNPPPANAPGAEATGTQPANITNQAAIQCPICQHRFVLVPDTQEAPDSEQEPTPTSTPDTSAA